jgi:hypothetical protein
MGIKGELKVLKFFIGGILMYMCTMGLCIMGVLKPYAIHI